MESPNRDWPRRWPWIVVGLTLLLVTVVRLRLSDMPLDRREGEHACTGQLLLAGIAPYKQVHDTNLPGIGAIYASLMAGFGQTPVALRLGLCGFNLATIVLLFLVARRILDPPAGAVAAAAYGLLSLSPSLRGLAAHAEHFAILPALGGLLYLLVFLERHPLRVGLARFESRPAPAMNLVLVGLLPGLAFLVSGSGAFFALFSLGLLCWARFEEVWEVRADAREELMPGRGLRYRRKIQARARRPLTPPLPPRPLPNEPSGTATIQAIPPVPWKRITAEAAAFAAGFALPSLVACLLLWEAGALRPCLRWVFFYPLQGLELTSPGVPGSPFLERLAGPEALFWVVAAAGLFMLWWEDRLTGPHRFLLGFLLACSAAAAALDVVLRMASFGAGGLLALLPAVSLLIAVAGSRALLLVREHSSIERLVSVAVAGVLLMAAGVSLIGNGAIWFGATAKSAAQEIHGTTLLAACRRAGEFVRTNSPPTSTVLTSEPQVCFYSQRRPAAGFFPADHRGRVPLALRRLMEEEAKGAQPDYVVYQRSESDLPAANWWELHAGSNLDLMLTLPVVERQKDPAANAEVPRPTTPSGRTDLLVFKRRSEAR